LHQQQTTFNFTSPSSTNTSTLTTSPQSFGPFILRKKFCYQTKYNLTSLIRDIETGLRDSKFEVSVNYFSFENEKTCQKKRNNSNKESSKLVTEPSTNETKELKSCLRHNISDTNSENNQSSNGEAVILDDKEFGNDFKNLKITNFSNLHTNLSRFESLIITMNVEYCSSVTVPSVLSANNNTNNNNNNNIATGSSLSSSSSNNSSSNFLNNLANNTVSSNATIVPTYSRMSSYSGTVANKQILEQQQQQHHQTSNLMTKSMYSNSGVDLLDLSSSVMSTVTQNSLQYKRTYLYAICNARTKTITFYVFTTETSNYEQLRQLLDNSCEISLQRYHLANNTVLYKYGGLIGDSLINDLKKVKQITSLAVHNAFNSRKNNSPPNDSTAILLSTPNTVASNSSSTMSAEQKIQQNTKILYRNYNNKSDNKSGNQSINTSLINNLSQHFGASQTQTNNTLTTSSQSQISFKQLFMASTSLKQFDSTINIVNQQINFCHQFLSNIGDSLQTSLTSISLLASSNNYSPLVRQTSMVTNPSTGSNIQFQPIRQAQSNPYGSYSSTSTLYGVGLNYQLCELQHLYRHPRKIYELALTLVSHNNNQTSSLSSTANTIPNNYGKQSTSQQTVSSTNKMNQLTVNDFYRNYIVPVLIPFHFCCSPILFCSNWNDLIVNESSLRIENFNKSSMKATESI
jgi:hypothetical protein